MASPGSSKGDKTNYNRYRSGESEIPRTTRWRLNKKSKLSEPDKKGIGADLHKLAEKEAQFRPGSGLPLQFDGDNVLIDEETLTPDTNDDGGIREGPNVELLFEDLENEESGHRDCSTEPEQAIYEGSSLTLNQSMMLILTFAFRHGLTGQCLSDLLTLISLHCLSPNICRTSLFLFRKYFADIKMPLVFHRYCSKCLYNVTQDQNMCPICNSDLSMSKATSFFVEISLEHQLSKLFRREGFHSDLCHRFHRQKKCKDNIEDIYDGLEYQKFFKADGFLSDVNNISLMWYTDGVAIFKSSKFSIWPLFFSINELPYDKRMQSENLLFGGLWFGEGKPAMGTFLKPFCASIEQLNKVGVNVDCSHCKENVNVKVLLLCGTCDLPAKSTVLNMNQFNGKHSCLRCKQEGRTVKAGKGHTRVFPFVKADPCGPERGHQETISHSKQALETGEAVFGIKGPSWLSFIQPDIIHGTAVDYMHCVLLGIVKRMLTLWFSPQFSSETFSISKQADNVDRRLLKIKPPNFVTRVARSLKDHSAYWKANECRSWLLYYSVPVLYGLLDTELFCHHLLLVEAVYLLSCQSISKGALARSKVLLTYFVCLYEALYGERHMSANLHQLLHLPEVVQDLGPLWVYSCFSFEDMNGQLIKLFHGTQHPQIQISTAISTLLHLPEIGQTLGKGTSAEMLYLTLCKKGSRTVSNCQYVQDGIGIVGRRISHNLSYEHHNMLTLAIGCEPKEILCFYRLFKDGTLFQSLQYTAVEERNSYTVTFKESCGNTKIGHVEKYIEVHVPCNIPCIGKCSCQPHYLAVIKELENNADVSLINGVTDEKLVNVMAVKSKYTRYRIIPVTDIRNLCVYVQLNDGKDTAFVCISPNSIESD